MNSSTYRWCYRTLGVSSDIDWKDLRTAYRRKLHACHPDLAERGTNHAGDVMDREAVFKETVQAFGLLSDYYKQHGRLPHPWLPISTQRIGVLQTTTSGPRWARASVHIHREHVTGHAHGHERSQSKNPRDRGEG